MGLCLGLWGCGVASDGDVAANPLPWQAEPLGLAPEPEANPSTPEKVELGRLLFYDPILSVDGDTACATCHSEIWGMSDGLALSIGTGGQSLTGPGRDGENITRRNAQTLWNVAYREDLFWDGRATSLEQQALMPIAEPLELGRDPDVVASELAEIDEYAQLFEAAFPRDEAPVTSAHMADALASFQRTMISDHSAYDQYVEGDARAMDEATQRGMWLFAELECHSCHAPPRFEAEGYANRMLATPEGVTDEGRFEVTGDEADRGHFRIPTLRNLRETSPYFHDGRVATLPEAVGHEARVQTEQLGLARLSPTELSDLIDFVDKALMDRSREPDRPERVPSELPLPIDGFRIPR